MINKAKKYIKENNLLTKDDKVVIGVSGGVDSIVLLDLLLKIKEEYNLTLIIAHVNHNVRKESELEYEFVKKLAKISNLDFEYMKLNFDNSDNFHNYSRDKRFKFFYDVSKKYNANKVALAHHLDDQVETILMRINRGSFFKGYGGILPETEYLDISVIRPLLFITKDKIYDYASKNKLHFEEDYSNQSNKYTRNRYRNNIIPLLKKENTKYYNKFSQFSNYILEANDILEEISNDFIENYAHLDKDISVNTDDFNKLKLGIKRYVLIDIINRLSNNSIEVSFDKLNSIIELFKSVKPHVTLEIEKNMFIKKEYSNVIFKNYKEIYQDYNIQINTFGEFKLPTGDFIIISNEEENKKYKLYTNIYKLCYNDKVFPILVRNRRNGDKIAFSFGNKKLKDIYIDLKIPKSERNRLPVITDSKGNILWVPTIKKRKVNKEYKNKIYIIYKRGE